MFNKILVAIDRSELSTKVFEQALSLGKLTSANLMLLHVLSHEEDGSPDALIFPNIDYYPGWNEQSFKLYQENWEQFKNEGLQILQSFSNQANTFGVQTEFTQNTGSPGRLICELANTWNADLIIVGRRGLSGLREVFLGSVSNYVLHHAPCSVQIVYPQVSSEKADITPATTSTAGRN